MKALGIRKTVSISLLGAIAFLLMFIEFPIIPITPWLKIDFSDIPVLLGLLIYGPVGAILVTALKCFLHALVYGMSIPELIGVFSSFVASITLILPFHWSFSHEKWTANRRYVIGIITSTVCMVVIMSLLNWLVIMPVYMQVLGMKLTISLPKLVLIGIVPFNLIKGVLLGLVFMIIGKRMSHWLAKQI
ncbi:membrane protein [Paucilactobacillus hokkaidonensis JCM 18461]|uniref:Riboflavin transporter n=2 Tax=Paucilactobacillus hokkaidonensis TaxID=1193095 RepID=A0A0A1GYZ3_9LACO|nr:ECF transporter S component [Paucilactobacillus hokkaidonensis]KRO10694.1 integral membrane protein [Paucilactobacillus hokkaidonensis]BAP85686.1 membrane protein [Paucilactobacillus hokkaidonensis JCM 18461]